MSTSPFDQLATARAELAAVKAERDRLQRWKDEALPVIAGLQELGRILGVPLGVPITGATALEAARRLRTATEAPPTYQPGRVPQ